MGLYIPGKRDFVHVWLRYLTRKEVWWSGPFLIVGCEFVVQSKNTNLPHLASGETNLDLMLLTWQLHMLSFSYVRIEVYTFVHICSYACMYCVTLSLDQPFLFVLLLAAEPSSWLSFFLLIRSQFCYIIPSIWYFVLNTNICLRVIFLFYVHLKICFFCCKQLWASSTIYLMSW